MIMNIIIATISIGILGLLVGTFLGISGNKLAVEVNPKEEEVLEALPGNNCGGCGFAGCSGLAAAIAEGKAPVNACPVGGEPVGEKIAAIMGMDAEKKVRLTAFVRCQGDCEKSKRDYSYTGQADCSMLTFVPGGGPKSCNYGCLGMGNCVRACMFDAIHVVDGVAVVDKDKCKACGKCVEACPKSLIELIPYDNVVHVACNSNDKGPVAMKKCDSACIGCGICEKNCPVDAIKVDDFLAKVDYDKCVGCGLCVSKCPKKAIVFDEI